MNFIAKLAEESQGIVKALKTDRFKGLLNLLTELYPDNAHFIYELLQNAEDAQATKVMFVLTSEDLKFLHNGQRQFTEKDIESITGIGNTQKKDDINQIGKFGVGFKAVFSYTQTPQIFSGKYAFEIHDLVCPKEIKQILNPNDKATVFCFPFNHPEKSKEKAFQEIKETLLFLPDNTILFLQNIKEISWKLERENKEVGYIRLLPLEQENHFEVERKTNQSTKTYWLRFTEKIAIENDETSQESSIALAFRLEKTQDTDELKIDGKVTKGDVSIFFPAEKEISNLKFFLHAPFSATVARDSIQNRPENNELRDLLVNLLVESLTKIKELGLLNRDFLSVLPNKDDQLSNFYSPFREAVINAFQTQNLTPTWKGEFLPAKNLLQSNDEIKEIINKDSILSYIIDDKEVKNDFDWAISPQRIPRVSIFLETLKIPQWNWEVLLKQISKTFYNQTNTNKLEDVSDNWLQSFYALLGKAKQETPYKPFYGAERIEDSYIVRLQNGEFAKGKSTYFQTEFVKDSKDVQIVKVEIYNFGRDETLKEKAKGFLKLIGVREFEEKDEILTILKQYYTRQNLRYTKEQNIRHLQKFIDFCKRNQDEFAIFSDYLFLRVENKDTAGNYLNIPSLTFIDAPFEDTKLSSVEGFLNMTKLWHGYIDEIKPKRDFVAFLKAVGVISTLSDEYQKINWFENTLKNKSKEVSLLFWESMCAVKKDFHELPYNAIRNEPHRDITSKLIRDLSYYTWIPDKNGKFRIPQEMTKEMLPDEFVYNNKNGWLSAIGFEANAKKSFENEERNQAIVEQEKIHKAKVAKEAGFDSVEEMEDAKEFAKMPPEKKALWEDFKQKAEAKQRREKIREDHRKHSNRNDSTKKRDFIPEIDKTKEEEEEENKIKHRNTSKYETTQLVEARNGQGIFRANVERIEKRCRLTNVSNKRFLIASHIKPWRKCTDEEKLDGNNGLLLSPHVDKLFDKGWISFTDEGEILCVNFEVEEIMEMWNLDVEAFVGSFNEQQKKYLAYHRNSIFKYR